ncbi:MAG: Lateral flagellin [Hydrogenophaga sp.]|uniref:flagellin N-terminal helical domain-containing protein n=1 Tax=Hydrogenophaga sp. TaxID=1904254 RepID=UPI0025C15CB7|nr:flagellin [Hydrogenophaga sp.]MBU7572438.1 Lateral flagellin [Hydrogenophaga sp.]
MLSLHTNYASLSTQNALGSTQKTLTTSMARLGTGFRINSAMDDAAGLQIATRMNAQSRGMAVAMRNTQNGISMMQTAEGAFKEMTNIVTRMKDLATEAANGSATQEDRDALQSEFDQLGEELGNIMTNSSFAGEALFSKDGTAGKLGAAAVTFQIGATTAETMDVDVTTALGDLGTDLDAVVAPYPAGVTATAGTEIASAAAANTAIDDLADVLDSIGAVRAQLGASSNRLESVYNNLGNQRTQTEASKGRIMDVDYAAETANMTKNQMLMQASTSMLKQSSSMSQLVMSLMQ